MQLRAALFVLQVLEVGFQEAQEGLYLRAHFLVLRPRHEDVAAADWVAYMYQLRLMALYLPPRELRPERNAEAGLNEVAQRVRVVALEGDVRAVPAEVEEVRHDGAEPVVFVQHQKALLLQVAQVDGLAHRKRRRERNGELYILAEHERAVAREYVRQRRGDAEVELSHGAFLNQMKVDERLFLFEFRQNVGKQRRGREDVEDDRRLLRAGGDAHLVRKIVQRAHYSFQPLLQRTPGVVELYPLSLPLEQRGAELRLQQLYRLADRRLRNVQLLRRL